MGHQHPTAVPTNADKQPVNTVYLVEDWSDSWHPCTVGYYTNRATAEKVQDRMENKNGYADGQRYRIKERNVYSSAESFFNQR